MDEDTGLLRATVSFPFAGEAPWTRLLFGAALQFLAGVVVVGAGAAAATTLGATAPVAVWLAVGLAAVVAYVPLLGYVAGTMRGLLDDDREPPGFGDWGSLLRDGRRFAGVTLLYAAPLAAIAAATTAAGSPTAALAVAAVAGLYGLAAAYVLPAAWVVVVNTGTVSAAWDRETLGDAVADRRYLGRWLLGAGVVAVGGAVGAALAVVVLGFAVLFAAQVAATYAVTRGVIHSLDLSLEDPPPAPASGYVPGWEDGPERKELSEGRLGGSLLPTTPGSDDDDAGSEPTETPPTPGSLATTDDDGAGATDLDRTREAPDGGDGAGATGAPDGGTSSDAGSDIERFVEDDDEIERDDG